MRIQPKEQGFVLITALVVLLILTILSVGLYYRSVVNQQTSVSDRDATKAYYLAEAGLNYIAWALYTDPSNSASNNTSNLDGDSPAVADNLEIQTDADQLSNNTLGYFDIANTIGYDPSAPVTPTLSSLAIPAHVALDITTNGSAVSVSAISWGTGIAEPSGDGAVVWVTSAVRDDANPINEVDTTDTSDTYSLYAYSIGYVGGTRMKLLRAKVGTIGSGFPANLGSFTNGFQ